VSLDDLHRPWLVAFILALAVLEAWWRVVRAGLGYDRGQLWITAGIAAGQFAIMAVTAGMIGTAALWIEAVRPFTIDMSLWWTWPLALLVSELFYYWFHRLSHETRWMWASHAVHHSPTELTLPAALRLGWTGFISGAPLFPLAVTAAGFPAAVAFGLLLINLRWQYFLHTEAVGRLGFVDLVINTPSNHRVHHACNAAYLDRNYGGILMLWDHVFGTYAREQPVEPCRYGLVTPPASRNPVVIALHQWPPLLRDMAQAGSLPGALRVALSYPAGRPAPHVPMADEVTAQS
jgi:sterol desaturase/sphingolipid hydroxylase (fatty acid hydroxylase superfamily)